MKARRTGGKPVTCKNLRYICLYCRRPTNSHWSIQGDPRWSCSTCFVRADFDPDKLVGGSE